MGWGPSTLRALLLFLDSCQDDDSESCEVGGAQVLATGKSAGETDIKYALIGTALGFVISAGFLALKICMIRKHLLDNNSSDMGFNETVALKKRAPRNAQVIEL